MYFSRGTLLNSLQFISFLCSHSSFLLCPFCFYSLLRKCFVSFAHVCSFFFVFSPPIYGPNFLSLFWNVLFCFYYWLPVPVFYGSPFLHQYFLGLFLHVVFSVFSDIVSSQSFHFLSTFACARSFFICSSSLISHPVFVILLEVFRGISILSLTNFVPIFIRSFSSGMLSVGIFFNNSFTFLFSRLTFFQC